MKIITIGALKGGVGKTNFVFQLSGVLAKLGKNVLLIDLDPQGNLTQNYEAMSNRNGSDILFSTKVTLTNIKNAISKTNFENVDIIGTNIYLTETELNISSRTARETILIRNFNKLNLREKLNYDYIIVDTAPSMSLINKNALGLADSIITLSDNSINSLYGATLFNELWKKIASDLDISNNLNAIILSRINQYSQSKEAVEYSKKWSLKDKVYYPPIRQREKYVQSEKNHLPVAYDGKSIEQTNYLELVFNLKKGGVL